MRGELHVLGVNGFYTYRSLILHYLTHTYRDRVRMYDCDVAGEIRLKLRLPAEKSE